MKAIRNSGLFISMIVLLLACDKVTYRKSPGGMPYKVYKGDGKRKIVSGNIIKYHVMYKINDSVYYSSFGRPPIYTKVGEPTLYDVSEIWTKLAVGDSIITTQMIDTFIKRDPLNIPPTFRKGERLLTYYKILDLLTVDSLVFADQRNEQKKYLASEIDFLEKYLADKKVNAQKTASGAFVEITDPGTGNLIDSGKYVSVKYTGATMSGLKFDSNVDSAFNHVEPLSFVVNRSNMIKGFDEAMRLMRLGGSAKLYIPSMLGYGAKPDPRSGIKPYEHLVFNLTVIDVKDKAPEELGPGRGIKVDPAQPNK